jgi:hypothetical protein
MRPGYLSLIEFDDPGSLCRRRAGAGLLLVLHRSQLHPRLLGRLSLGASQWGAGLLVAKKSVNKDTISDLTQSLIDVRRGLLADHPLMAQAAAPSTEANALIPIHPGAAAYFGGEERGFLDKYSDKLYYASMLGGSLISILLAAWLLCRFSRCTSEHDREALRTRR